MVTPVLYLSCGIRTGGGACESILEAPGVPSRLNGNVQERSSNLGDLSDLHTQPQQLLLPGESSSAPYTLPHCPGLTQNTVEAKLLKALAAVGHVPGLRDLHRQELGPVHRFGTLLPWDPSSTVHVGCVGSLHRLQLLDTLGHRVTAQLVAQQ